MEDVLTSADITTQIAQVDSMIDRVEKVIGRERPEKPLRPDVSYPRHKRIVNARPMVAAQPKPTPRHHVIASGELTGNELRMSSGYSSRPSDRDDCDPDGMWAAFETEFDEMVAGMR